jgi:hypothetical protein
MKKLIMITGLAACHFVVSMAAFFLSFAGGMSRFETGMPPSTSKAALEMVSSVLLFPVFPFVVSIIPKAVPSSFQYVPFLLNSLLWGTCLYFLPLWFIRRRKENRGELPAA